MAGVFLSYDRDDAAAAKVIAAALEAAGHSVWWDKHISGGAQFSKVIEEALKAAEVVVVLWSTNSIESSWVRDEAAAGRDSGRLVPATIDGTNPPLGFGQYQTIRLTDWKRGTKSSGIEELLRVLSNLSGALPARAAQVRKTPRGGGLKPSSWLAAGAIVAIVAVGALTWRLTDNRPSTPVVAVGPADGAKASAELARDILVKLGNLQSAPSAQAMQLVAKGAGETPTLTLDITEATSRVRAEATVALFDGKDHSLLWSKEFQRTPDKLADLKQGAAYTAGQVLSCALEALSANGERLNQQSFKLYLNGCATYADRSPDSPLTLVPLFVKLTRAEPKFLDGWAKLLLVESEFARMTYRPEATSILAALPTHIAAARRLDPNLPEALLAEAALLPDNAFERRLALLDRAARKDPDNRS